MNKTLLDNIKEKGFTMMEVLVVIAVIGVIGYVLTDLLTRSFKGSTKTALVGDHKHVGDVAMDTLTREIRNSDQVICSNASVITLKNNLGIYRRYAFVSNNIRTEDLTTTLDLRNPTNEAELCNLLNTTDINASNSTLLANTTVRVQSGNFSVKNNAGFKDVVSISFELTPSTTGVGYENQLGGSGAILFNTTVQLR